MEGLNPGSQFLTPKSMTIDSHHHFWNYSPADYGWMGEGMDVLKRDFGPKDMKPLIAEAGIEGVVSVQAQMSLEENDALLAQADLNDWIRGVVGWIDLTRDDAADHLAKYAAHEKFVGVREVLQDMDDDACCLRDDFNRGIARLREFDLVYDILIFHRHLPNSIAFVDRHPDQIFVLDHVAKPDIQSAKPAEDWAKHIAELAKRERVFCKVSGMVTEISPSITEWTPELLRPYFDIVLEAFGPDRLMFGSDWPVCLLRCDYERWADTVNTFIAELSADEQAAIRGGTAMRAYHL